MTKASLQRFRILLLAAAVLYPGWSAVNRFVTPEGVDDLLGRLLVSAFCGAMIGLTFVGNLRRFTAWFCFVACCVIVTHNAYLVSVNQMNLVYVLGYTLAVFGLAVSFESHALFLAFITYTITVTMLSAQGEPSPRLLFCGSATLALAMSYLAFRDKLVLFGTLRQKNDELEKSQMSLRNTAQVANIGGWSLDVENNVLWWSEQTYAIHEIAPGSPIDWKAAIEFYAPKSRAVITDAVDRAVREQKPWDLQLPFVTAKGSSIWVRVIGKPVVTEGRTTSLHGSFQNISDEMRLKEEDRRLNQLLTTVLDNLPHGIFAKNLSESGKYVLWNKGMENLFRVSARDVMGKDDTLLFDAKDLKRKQRLESYVLEGKCLLDVPEEDMSTKLVHFPAHTMRMPVLDAGGTPQLIVGIIEDISEVKKREALIQSQQTQLIQSSRMSTLGEMSGGVAHEINNPLTIIMGFAQRISLGLESGRFDVEEMRRSAAKIIGMSERIAKIVRGLRTFSREASHDPFTPTPVHRIVDDTLDLCRQRFVSSGIELEVAEIPPELVIECRSVQVSQVLLNLLNNAHDAIQDKAVKWIKVFAREQAGQVEISVVDSGKGIPPDVADKILQPFFTTKGVGVGTGLGLSISKGIVESHKGRIYYDPGSKNTRFVVLLPKKQMENAA